jgi:predicted Na+-dependent transporter
MGIISLILLVIMPISIGLCSGNWVTNSVADGTLDYIKIFSAVMMGFSLSLIFSFAMTTIGSRFPERDLQSEMMWGCVNIFVSGSLGAIFAGISVGYRLSIY